MRNIVLTIISIFVMFSVFGQNISGQKREIYYPDNVDSANCVIYPDGNIWDVKIGWSSDNVICHFNIPLVGDLNDDGIPEIVCFTKGGYSQVDNPNGYTERYNNELIVFDGFKKNPKATITLPPEQKITANDAAAYGLVKISNRKGLIVIACCDYFLRAYDITKVNNNEPYWVSDVPYGWAFSDWAVNIGFADFNSDGIPEIYVRNKIYNAETGKLLAQADGPNTGSSYGHWSHQKHYKISSPIAADVLGDRNLELILGNNIYSVDINNPNGLESNSITLVKHITPPEGVVEDGHAQVADFNSDGFLDVFISVRNNDDKNGTVYGYVWDVYNDIVSTPFAINTSASGKSIPFIGDIDNDDLMEVLIQCGPEHGTNTSSDHIAVRAFKYNPETRTFSFMWDMVVKENSFSNGITAFDFNQDGLLELIICDEDKLRIVNGSGKSHITYNDTIDENTGYPMYVMETFLYEETTIMQYPVIVDVDDDGMAEIVSVGSDKLNIIESDGGMWAPTRKVWNQYMYNVTNVNNDLTLPSHHFNNATPFIDPYTGEVCHPFNNFLQQATTIDRYGHPFFAAADIAVSNIELENFMLKVYYRNDGDVVLNAPYYITVYANTYGGELLKLPHEVPEALPPKEDQMSLFSLNKYVLCGNDGLKNVVVALNCSGIGIAQNGGNQYECDTLNNVGKLDFTPYSSASDTLYIHKTTCEPFTFRDVVFDTSGQYLFVVDNMDSCDSIIMLDLIIKDSLDFEIQGLSDVIVASHLWPGTYNYYISDSLYMPDCHFTWTCSNPLWEFRPSENSFSCQLVVLDTIATTLTVEADCDFGCMGSHSLHLKPSHIYDHNDDLISDVYPNPSRTSLTVKGDRLRYVTFYDTSGRMVKKYDIKLPLPEIVVDVRDLRRGVYIVEIETMLDKVFKRVVLY